MRDGLQYLLEKFNVTELTRYVEESSVWLTESGVGPFPQESLSIQKTALPYQSPFICLWFLGEVVKKPGGKVSFLHG